MTIDLEMEEIVKVFFEESFEGLDVMESSLLNLDGGANPEIINTVFRAAHSIKGGAGTFGFAEISHFTHSVETLLDEMRNGTRVASPEAVQLLLRSVDVVREMIVAAQAKQTIPIESAQTLGRELALLLRAADDHKGGGGQTSSVRSEPLAPTDLTGAWSIEFTPSLTLLQTCNDPLRLFEELKKLGTLIVDPVIDALPSLEAFEPTMCYLAWHMELQSPLSREHVMEAFEWVDTAATIKCDRRVVGAEPSAEALAGSPSIPAGRSSGPRPVPLRPMEQGVAGSKPSVESGSIRVAIEKIDTLINLVGELVITQSMLNSLADTGSAAALQSLRRGLTQLARNTRELQENAMRIRMLPISFSFNRFPRLVHDLSRKLGKEVELRLMGENTELDKTVLEKLSDPLVHLVRNALDHGLEDPGARLAAGKPTTGVITLNAFHEGGNIIIEVKDDGAGLNKERILAKARERGLLATEEGLSDTEVYNLIFEAGFSTAETISDVSGRGVGMDVVRRNIIDLGGHVQISSVAGKGSTIRIRLPLTLAILEGQMLRVGREIYVASLISIVETVQLAREHLSEVPGTGEIYCHRDTFIPVIRLREIFGVSPDSAQVADGLLVVVEADGQRAAILVDELLAQQQVVIKSLESNFRQLPGLAGATIHGDGSVALILDVPGLITTFTGRHVRPKGVAA